MAATAAIRSGAGYAAAAVPSSLEPILEVKLTEVMTLGADERDGSLSPRAAEQIIERARSAGCVVLGPGLGRDEGAAELARGLCRLIEQPLLVDADGLGALGSDLKLLARRHGPTIVTPHAGELGRLLAVGSDEISARRLESARDAARRSAAIVVLIGDDTIGADANDGDARVAVNAISSPGLATAGSGDVLSGAIAALVARGLDPFEACCAGVLAHARAGKRAADRIGAESVIATDVIGALPAGLTP
jgi:NAD(P)H-hydrate epimerase